MHILLIEDDAETAAHIARGLRAEGHVLDIATDGVDGLHHATEGSPDLLIVDRMLPGLDGVAVVRALRAAGSRVPVLFLTALNAVQDRVEGLDAGADDYLAKPFSFAELKARISALSRRPPLREEGSELSVGDLRIDRLRRRVTRGGDAVNLQPREYQLLEYLVMHAGSVVTRTMLLEAIWDFHFDPGSNIVESHICRLRGKIDRGNDPPLIKTVRGAGYVIRAH
ncbi:MAG: response regulator transcription factor [Woeseiaceae bacterium]